MSHGFVEQRTVELEELNGILHQYVHERTGLKLVWLEREEENKTFGILFPTIPSDDTGVFHILEHSVLCGSDRYPVKAPFVELMKHSLNTFLNAMTFPDRTFFPVSSQNDKDFVNLMRVYLDAVFRPAIYHNREIFLQEGWHLESEGDGVFATGVVLNEMRGAFADSETKLSNAMTRGLFPDNEYRFISGGDPVAIPDLTYEKFVETHRKFYAPANAYVVLDGKLDFDVMAKILDEEYLSGLEAGKAVEMPMMQQPVDAGEYEVVFEVSPEEDLEHRYSVAWGRVFGTYADREQNAALKVLSDVLSSGNQSPLNRCVLSEGLAESAMMYVDDATQQTQVLIRVQNLAKENIPLVEERIFAELEKLATNGIDRDQLDAALTNYEFVMREKDFGGYPQGLVYGMSIMDKWIYGGNPELGIQIGDLFDNLRRKMDEGYFEQLIREVILDNGHKCKVVLIPETMDMPMMPEMMDSEMMDSEMMDFEMMDPEFLVGMMGCPENENPSVQALSENLDDKGRAEIIAELEALNLWQSTPDSPEALASLPMLELSDIPQTPEDIPTEELQIDGTTVLLHKVPSNDIAYINLYFDANGLSEEELSALAFATIMMSDMGTEDCSPLDLLMRKKKYCGMVDTDVACYDRESDGFCRTFLSASYSALNSNVKQATGLMMEILTKLDMSDEEDARNLLNQNLMGLFQMIMMNGSQFAMGRAAASINAEGVVGECTGGIAFYQWMKKQSENWNYKELVTEIQGILSRVICKERMTISITGDFEGSTQELVAFIKDRLPMGNQAPETQLVPWPVKREGIAIPADVAFAVAAGGLDREKLQEFGHAVVAANVMSLDYLWNAIRVQGGAYGAGMMIQPSGFFGCYSFRDPDPMNSIETYAKCGDYLKSIAEEEEDLTGFIIGTISENSPLMTARMKGAVGDQFFFRGISYEDRCRRRTQMLQTSYRDMPILAEALSEGMKEAAVCVVGGADKLAACNLGSIFTL